MKRELDTAVLMACKTCFICYYFRPSKEAVQVGTCGDEDSRMPIKEVGDRNCNTVPGSVYNGFSQARYEVIMERVKRYREEQKK